MDKNCFDDAVYQIKGALNTGVALKEVTTLNVAGYKMVIEEEVVSLTKTPIADSMFDPPAGYAAANTLKEVDDNTSADWGEADGDTAVGQAGTPTAPQAVPPTFALPKAGVEKGAVGVKQSGMIRIGILKPAVTTPDTKKDPEAGADLALAASQSFVESLKADGIEAVDVASPGDAQAKGCDYIVTSTVTQKRGGGGFGFGKMMAMSAVMMAGAMVPGVGAMVASTVASQVMSQTMQKAAKAKDEFTLDYKVTAMDNSAVASGSSKNKSEKDGDDVLTPQIQTASKAILAKVKK